MPSAAPSSTVARNSAADATGRPYVGSAAVRSGNHRAPPRIMEGTPASARERRAEKKPMNRGACTSSVPIDLSGWQSYFAHTAASRAWYSCTAP